MQRGAMMAIGVALAACATTRELTVVTIPSVEASNEPTAIPSLTRPHAEVFADALPKPAIRYSALSKSHICPGIAGAIQVEATWTSATMLEVDLRGPPGTIFGQPPATPGTNWRISRDGVRFSVDAGQSPRSVAYAPLNCPTGAARFLLIVETELAPRRTAHVGVGDF